MNCRKKCAGVFCFIISFSGFAFFTQKILKNIFSSISVFFYFFAFSTFAKIEKFFRVKQKQQVEVKCELQNLKHVKKVHFCAFYV
jgi:hypothetical protein